MKYEIDTRPLPVVILTHSARYLIFIALGLGFFWFIRLSPPEGLTTSGLKAIAVFLLCLILWVSQLLPLAATGLVAVLLPAALGILESRKVYSLFGNQAVFFILGAFILAAAVMQSGLSTRLTLALLTRARGGPRRLVVILFLVALFFSFWIPEHAVAIILFPIVFEITHALKLRPGKSRYGASLFLAMAWGSIIGGITTFLGGARTPLALAILESTHNLSIGFFEWMKAALPITLLSGAAALFVILRFFAPDVDSVMPAVRALDNKMFSLGKMSFKEKAIAAVMLGTITSWILWSSRLGLANIALSSVVVLFVFRLIEWKTIEQYVNWGIILMYGGAIVLGVVLRDTGAAEWLSGRFLNIFSAHSLLFVCMLGLIAMLLTEAVSNSAVVAILLPMALGMSEVMGIDPRFMALAVAIPSGLAFTFPMSSPPNAIAHSADFFTVKDIIIPGFLLSVMSWIAFVLVARFYWPAIGFNL